MDLHGGLVGRVVREVDRLVAGLPRPALAQRRGLRRVGADAVLGFTGGRVGREAPVDDGVQVGGVGEAVTVVVHAVAPLRGVGVDGGAGGGRVVAVARREGGVAAAGVRRAQAARLGRVAVAVLIQVAVVGDAAVRVVLVGGAVAVLVAAAADLDGGRVALAHERRAVRRADPGAVGAEVGARLVVAGLPLQREVLVGEAVAVVVQLVTAARLVVRLPAVDGAVVADPAVHAGAGGRDLGTDTDAADLAGAVIQAQLLVGEAVAVVVLAVADLGRVLGGAAIGHGGAGGQAAVHSTLDQALPTDADALAGLTQGAPVPGELLVGVAVAVVVQGVADLDLVLGRAAAGVGGAGDDLLAVHAALDGALAALAPALAGLSLGQLFPVGRVRVDEPLVDLAVAVVVQGVAELQVRGDVGGAGQAVALGRADHHAASAGPRPAGRAFGERLLLDRIRPHEVLVGEAVAVVVQGVAGELCAVLVVGHGREVALPQPVGAGGGDVAHRAFSQPGAGRVGAGGAQLLVGEAVAVVVELVADLDRDLGRGAAGVGGAGGLADAGALDHPLAALAHALTGRAGGELDVEEALVHEAVAVVVELVADLVAHLAGRSVGIGRAGDHLVGAALDQPDAAGAHAVALGAQGQGPQLRIGVARILVGVAVAVVVQPVAAGLLVRLVGLDLAVVAVPGALHAGGDHAPARAHPRVQAGAVVVLAVEPLIGVAVAVVVHEVADLQGGLRGAPVRAAGADDGQAVGEALDQARATGALTLAGRAHGRAVQGEALVGEAVAVVVQAFTALARGGEVLGAAGGRERGRVAEHDAARAQPGPAGLTQRARRVVPVQVGERLVGEAVAVVVQVVAAGLRVLVQGHGRVVADPVARDALRAYQGEARVTDALVQAAGQLRALERLVGEAVAVVVQAVAGALLGLVARHRGVGAGPRALHAGRDRLLGADAQLSAAGHGRVQIGGLVAVAVAVVVQAVAGLIDRLDGVQAGHGRGRARRVGADARARHALALVAAAARRRAVEGVAVVDQGVAVVVQIVAELLRTRVDLRVAVVAVHITQIAVVVRVQGRVAGQVLAVAVLVRPVAALLRGARVDRGVVVVAVLIRGEAVVVVVVGRAGEVLAVAILIHLVAADLGGARVNGGVIGRAWPARGLLFLVGEAVAVAVAGQGALVGEAVAVVVDVIGRVALGAGQVRRRALHAALIIADDHAARAGADAAVRAQRQLLSIAARERGALVDLPITVVVRAVAALRGAGPDRGVAQRALGAGRVGQGLGAVGHAVPVGVVVVAAQGLPGHRRDAGIVVVRIVEVGLLDLVAALGARVAGLEAVAVGVTALGDGLQHDLDLLADRERHLPGVGRHRRAPGVAGDGHVDLPREGRAGLHLELEHPARVQVQAAGVQRMREEGVAVPLRRQQVDDQRVDGAHVRRLLDAQEERRVVQAGAAGEQRGQEQGRHERARGRLHSGLP